MPCCANTYHVKPLQSKPFGSAPAFLYGAPLSASAVPVTAYTSAAEGDSSPSTAGDAVPAGDGVPAGDAVPAGDPPCGVGKGRGTAPVDAHAADIAAQARRASAPVRRP